jgi:hypothetical protein
MKSDSIEQLISGNLAAMRSKTAITEPSAVAPDARVNFNDNGWDTAIREKYPIGTRRVRASLSKLTLASGATALGSVTAA